MEKSWVFKELFRARNFGPWFHKLGLAGFGVGALELHLTNLGLAMPWTFKHRHKDHEALKPADKCRKIDYPKPDGVVSFDKTSSVYLANVNHEEDQPIHLTLKDDSTPIEINLATYDAPEQRYCPAGVYEIVREDDRHQPAAADQRAELRALQDLRYQRPDPEHQLGHARGRRRAELPEHVVRVVSRVGTL